MKKFIKNNKKFVEGFVFGAVLFIGIATLVAYTATEITYTPSDTSWNVSDVKSALDDLYTKSQGIDSCLKTVVGSNGFTGYYYCNGSTARMIGCYYGGTYGHTFCTGDGNSSKWSWMCTLSTSNNSTLYYYCNTSLPKNFVNGGGMASSISCSC